MNSSRFNNPITSLSLTVASFFVSAPQPALALQEKNPPTVNKSFSDAMTALISHNEQSARLTHLSQGLISWQSLTAQEKQDRSFCLVGLKSQEWILALNSITKDLIEYKDIQEAIVEQLSNRGDKLYNKLVSNKTKEVLSSCESFKKLLLTDSMLFKKQLWDSLLDPNDQYFKEVKEAVAKELASLASYIDRKHPEEIFEVLELIPSVLQNDTRFCEIVIQCLEQENLSEDQLILCLDGFNIPKDLFFKKVTPLLESSNRIFAMTATRLFSDNLSVVDLESPNVRQILVSILSKENGTPIFLKRELMNSDRFIDLFVDSVRDNPLVACKIVCKLYESSPKLKEATLKVLLEPQILSTILESASIISTFDKVPPIALEIAEVCKKFRETCNFNIHSAFGARLPDSVVKSLPDFALYVPEILRVTRELGALKHQDFKTSDYVTINPNSFANLLNSEAAPPSEAINAYVNTITAMRLLHIDGLNRFDNAREIIINRYHIADPLIQTQLEDLMPPGYFQATKLDDRPFCIFIMAHHGADHNEVFSSMNSGMSDTDFVDSLTTSYRVLYYEVLNESELAQELSSLNSVHKVKAELCLIAGHGSHNTVTLGRFQENLGTDSEFVFKVLGNIMQQDGTVALISCSTGASNDNSKSIHSELVKAIPHCTVVAPDADTMLPYMKSDKNGKFVALEYVGANGVVYSPITKETNIEKGHNRWIIAYSRLFEYNPLMTLACSYVALSILRMGALFGIRRARGAYDAVQKATEEGQQKLLFPSFWDKGWVRRFARALVTDRNRSNKKEE